MQKNMKKALLSIAMLTVVGLRAEDSAAPTAVQAAAPAPTAVQAAAPAPTEASKAAPAPAPAETAKAAPAPIEASKAAPAPAPAETAKASLVSSLWGSVKSPFDWTRTNFWDKYPHLAGATATVVGFWVMYKTCPWFQDLIGCSKKRSTDETIF